MRSLWALTLLLAACRPSGSHDRVSARWQSRAPVPDARTEVSVTSDDSLIYLIGGYARGEGRRPATPRAMLVYDPARRTWRDGAPMPTPRGALAVAVLDGRIHAIGGNAAGGVDLEPHDHGVSASDRSVGTHEAYDPKRDTWTRLEPMPTARNHLGAAAIAGKIHVVGGRVPGDMELTTHEVYDPATDTWSEGPPVPTGRSGIAVVAHRGRLYVFGGETVRRFSSRTFEEAERFDPGTGRWELLPPMPTARHGLGAASLGEAIYVVSGGPEPGLTLGVANERVVELP